MEIRLMRPASVSQAPNEAGSASDYQGLFARYGALTTAAQAAAGSYFYALPTLGVNFRFCRIARQAVRHAAVSRSGCRSTGSLVVDRWRQPSAK